MINYTFSIYWWSLWSVTNYLNCSSVVSVQFCSTEYHSLLSVCWNKLLHFHKCFTANQIYTQHYLFLHNVTIVKSHSRNIINGVRQPVCFIVAFSYTTVNLCHCVLPLMWNPTVILWHTVQYNRPALSSSIAHQKIAQLR